MRPLNMMLHCGAKEVTRADLDTVDMPVETKTYKPIGHGYLADLVLDSMEEFNYKPIQSVHALNKNGSRYFGMAQVQSELFNSEDYSLIIGWRSSYDKSFPVGVVAGGGVFVCDNLCFSGEVKVKRKHTPNLWTDLPVLMYQAVRQIRGLESNQDKQYKSYQNTSLTDTAANDLIIKMLRAGVINTQRVEKVVQEYYEPSFEHGDPSIWRLFNATTETMKHSPLFSMPDRTRKLHEVLDQAVVIDGEFDQVTAVA